MPSKAPDNMRNVSFIAQGGAGKSVLIEQMLYMAKEVEHLGRRSQGNAVMSSEPEEKDHGFDITPHVGHLTWKDVDIHMIDTPGYFGFMEAARGVLPGCDGAVIIISALDGVKPESRRLWRMLKEFEIPVICFITQIDDPQADFQGTLESISESLGATAIPIALPIGTGENFCGVVDLLEKSGRTYKDGKVSLIDMPAEMGIEVDKARI